MAVKRETAEENRLRILKHLAEDGRPSDKSRGICSNVQEYSYLWVDWPEFSGDIKFPIQHPHKIPRSAYLDIFNLWDKRTRYGRARYRLCRYLYERLTEAK